MTAPHIPILFPLPTDGGIPKTYSELNRSMSCTCPAGAILKPSIPPIPGFNLADVIADQSKLLSALAAGYSMLTVVMKLVSCIIDVLCALINPFSTIAAVARLFGTCLPDFILLLPQLAIPAMILCLIKIILAIVTYILTVIVPLIQDIIANIENLVSAISTGNEQAAKAVAFKIVQLLKELYNVIGILSALDAILAMIKALLSLGLGIPCGGGGGSCGGCGDNQCPPVFENRTLSGTDGLLDAIPVFSGASLNPLIHFSSAQHNEDFLVLRAFFPSGIDYGTVSEAKDVPYLLSCNGDFAVSSIDEEGLLTLAQLAQPLHSDGYLSSSYNNTGIQTPVDPTGRYVRFGTHAKKAQFSGTDANGVTYLELSDTDISGAAKNSGTFRIVSVYDGYNVKLDHVGTSAWNIQADYDPSSGPGAKAAWRKVSVPTTLSSQPYTLTINHEELIRRGTISVGCHPDVRAAVNGAKNRSPFLDVPIPPLPPIDNVTACITAIAPIDVDTQYVLDNYESIAQNTAAAGACIADSLASLSESMVSYAGSIYPRLFSQDKSLLFSDMPSQVVGGTIVVSIVPMDINGNMLADDLPPGVVEVEAFTTFGSLSPVVEVVDAYGASTGEFRANLTSLAAGPAAVTASVAGLFVSDFDQTLSPPDYVARKLDLLFTPARPVDTKPRDSGEPLGISRGNR
jgi:hypothetical protein